MSSILALALAPCLLVFAGCPDREPVALYISAAIRPTDNCLFSPGAATYSYGIVDLVINRSGYLLGLEVTSALPLGEGVNGLAEDNAQLDANGILLTGALVNYRAGGITTSLPSDLFVQNSLMILPGASRGVAIDVMPAQVVDALRTDPFFTGETEILDPVVRSCLEGIDGETPTLKSVPLPARTLDILITIQFEGLTQGGNTVLSNEFIFTVRICNACLVYPSADPTAYLLAREEGETFCGAADTDRCYRGQDLCEEQEFCIQQYNNTDQVIYDKLVECALDPTFPAPAFLNFYHPLCRGLKPFADETVGDRLEHLRCLYGLEKAGAYCDGSRGLAYPPQPDAATP